MTIKPFNICRRCLINDIYQINNNLRFNDQIKIVPRDECRWIHHE